MIKLLVTMALASIVQVDETVYENVEVRDYGSTIAFRIDDTPFLISKREGILIDGVPVAVPKKVVESEHVRPIPLPLPMRQKTSFIGRTFYVAPLGSAIPRQIESTEVLDQFDIEQNDGGMTDYESDVDF